MYCSLFKNDLDELKNLFHISSLFILLPKPRCLTQAYATPELSPDDRERRPKDLFHFSSCLSVFLSARLLLPDLDELKNLFHISSCCPTVNQNATLIPCLLRSGGRLCMSSFISPPVSVSPLILLPGPVCTAHFSRMILMSLRISSIYPPVCTSVCLLTAAGLPLFLFHVFKNDLDDFQDLFHISSCCLSLMPYPFLPVPPLFLIRQIFQNDLQDLDNLFHTPSLFTSLLQNRQNDGQCKCDDFLVHDSISLSVMFCVLPGS